MAVVPTSEAGPATKPSLSQIRWQCRRGMLELDVMLERYVTANYADLQGAPLDDFLRLLACEDDQLWDWFSGRKVPEAPELAALCVHIRRPV